MKGCLLIGLVCLCVGISSAQEKILFTPKGIPCMYIDLEDGATIYSITKEEKLKARMRIENTSGSSYHPSELYDSYVEIKGRGNSTWEMPKKPFNIDLIDENGADNAAGLLGMPADEEWSLIANYADKSLMRISLAYLLGEIIGMAYSPRTRFLELYVNNEYQGIYALCEKIKRGKDRVDVSKFEINHGVPSGYIVEVMPENRITDSDSVFTTNRGGQATPSQILHFTTKYPKAKNITSSYELQCIADEVNAFEAKLFELPQDVDLGELSEYMDISSLVDWYIVNEFALNIDANMYSSVFLYKAKDGKLKMGPLWDFDLAFGNNSSWLVNDENLHRVHANSWFAQLWWSADFKNRVKERFGELLPVFKKLPSIIADNAEQLKLSGAIERNFEKWEILGVEVPPNNPPIPVSYEGEIQRLSDWIEARTAWLQVNWGTSTAERCERMEITPPIVRAEDPDEFWAGDPAVIIATKGYSGYVWNDTLTTQTDHITIEKGGEYRVKAINAGGCESPYSVPLKYVAKGLVEYTGDHQYEGGSDPAEMIRTIPGGLKTKSFILTGEGDTIALQEIFSAGVYEVTTEIDEPYYTGKTSYQVTLSIIPVEAITISPREITLAQGDETMLTYTINPGNASDKKLRWISDNPDIARVDDHGNVTAVSPGVTTITAETNDGAWTDVCVVTVTIATGNETAYKQEYKVYPNPADVYIHIELNDPGMYLIRLINSSGKIVKAATTGDSFLRMDVGDCPQGFYILDIENKNSKQKITCKIIISR